MGLLNADPRLERVANSSIWGHIIFLVEGKIKREMVETWQLLKLLANAVPCSSTSLARAYMISARSNSVRMCVPAPKKGNYYLGRIMQPMQLSQLVWVTVLIPRSGSLAPESCILPTMTSCFTVSRGMNQMNKIPAALFSYIQHTIRIDNHIEYMKLDKKP